MVSSPILSYHQSGVADIERLKSDQECWGIHFQAKVTDLGIVEEWVGNLRVDIKTLIAPLLP